MFDWHYGTGWGWFGALMMVIMMVAFWGGLITVVVILMRRFGHVGTHDARGPQKILEDRFARGEIDEEEFQRRRDTLRRTS